MSKPTKYILILISILLVVVACNHFKELNLLNLAQNAGTTAGNEINKNMNNN
ncbi:hypothetical protein R4447_00265 [Acinetobacter baumannii]|uniref:hypothetical protein n=1 Tax=Acinetobacter baumannii TaxID=470 RepID=UPI001402A85F|nr:hypothetical protein [Acinetobacter baumannii]MDC4413873.1 hypothetical protein [Acinetobacter baumannii]MDV7434997.1 hypothetical protein [Acinetobacter baumannii]